MDCLRETDGLICMFMCRTEGVGAGSILSSIKLHTVE